MRQSRRASKARAGIAGGCSCPSAADLGLEVPARTSLGIWDYLPHLRERKRLTTQHEHVTVGILAGGVAWERERRAGNAVHAGHEGDAEGLFLKRNCIARGWDKTTCQVWSRMAAPSKKRITRG